MGAWKGRPYVNQVNANLISCKRFLQPHCFRESYSKSTGKMYMGKRTYKTSEVIIPTHKSSKKLAYIDHKGDIKAHNSQ